MDMVEFSNKVKGKREKELTERKIKEANDRSVRYNGRFPLSPDSRLKSRERSEKNASFLLKKSTPLGRPQLSCKSLKMAKDRPASAHHFRPKVPEVGNRHAVSASSSTKGVNKCVPQQPALKRINLQSQKKANELQS
jgi:hypothetical protein